MSERVIVCWFRNDLRLHDQEAFTRALHDADRVVAVYCFDPRHFAETAYGFAKTGPFRARFLIESVSDLRESLRARGGDLVVRCGEPEKEIPALVEACGASAVYAHREITREEWEVACALEQALQPLDVSFQEYWGHTLYHADDLPFQIRALPDVFTKFRKWVERESKIRHPFDTPESVPTLPTTVGLGAIPVLSDLGLTMPPTDERMILPFKGGERTALEWWETYCWECDALRHYKETRNGMLTPEDSSKLSPWLALGCVSPRWIYQEVQRYERERVRNDSTYWLIFELIWRDYFRFLAMRYGDRIFYLSGLHKRELSWRRDPVLGRAWCEGRTGFPFVDAHMKELNQTGWMSNRGRQNVASFFAKTLKLDWRIGAAYFESMLIDYDPCSNWGNWAYVAGVGTDPRDRIFNVVKQGHDYDPKGDYVKKWLPALQGLPMKLVHQPYKISAQEQRSFGFVLGEDYPEPIVEPERFQRKAHHKGKVRQHHKDKQRNDSKGAARHKDRPKSRRG